MAERAHNLCYQTIHLPTGMQYLGVHSTDRDDLDPGYLGSGPGVEEFMRGKPKSEFVRHVIHDYPTWEQADRWERFAVTRREVEDPRFLNRQTGGGSRGSPGSSTRRKLRDANLGREVPPETREKIRVGNTGKRMSPEAVEKSAAKRRGGKRSDEAKARMSAAKRGKPVKPEHAAKRAASICRPVAVGDAEYPSSKAAAEAWGVSPSTFGYWLDRGINGARRLKSKRVMPKGRGDV